MELSDLISTFLAAVLTVMVLSYLVGDNPLFRIAMHLLVGTAAGYAGAIAVHNVLRPGLVDPLFEAGLPGLLSPAGIVTLILPGVLVVTLLMKASPMTARFGTPAMALLVGVGAAVVVGGAISGTLIPQTLATMQSLSPGAAGAPSAGVRLERMLDLVITLVGTLTTLLYFRFSSREGETPLINVGGISIPGPLSLLRAVGSGFIALTFAVMYAGALAATLIVLAERVQFLRGTFAILIGGPG